MLMKIRRAEPRSAMGGNGDFFEWQPPGSKNWYIVHRNKIKTNGYWENPQTQSLLIRQLFNAMYRDLTCVIHANYDRAEKTLEVKL